MIDNYELFEMHERERERLDRHKPICAECGERIHQDRAVRIRGAWICDQCLEDARENIGG